MLSAFRVGTAAAVLTLVMTTAPPAAGAATSASQDDGYPQETRTASLRELTRSQAELNRAFPASEFGRFTDYFPSPDFGVHVALLPTGKMLLFSFERVQSNPTTETAPTNATGAANAGRAYLWDPTKGKGRQAFKAVPPPVVDIPDGTGEPRPAPFFCSGHAYLPNGMLTVLGGNLGGEGGGNGARFAYAFDPWRERWYRQQEMAVGRWYPTVVTGADGRQIIVSGNAEDGAVTDLVERFPAPAHPVPVGRSDRPRDWSLEQSTLTIPFLTTYPHMFSLRDEDLYIIGRRADEQWVLDPETDTLAALPFRPDLGFFSGSAVPLPGGPAGPDSVLVVGGNRDDPNTYQLSDGQWTTEQPRAFGRTQDDTLLMPDGTLLSINGAFDIRDYGNGAFNPEADLKYRQVEIRDAAGDWRLGPAQRLPRGYHSNAVLLPDGRVMVTGDELQQLANDADISDDMNGTIEIYEPWYLHQGPRPSLDRVFRTELDYGDRFGVTTSTPHRVSRAVLLAPSTPTHSVNTSQRHVELSIDRRRGNWLTLAAPPDAGAAPPGYYMLFLLDDRGVPSTASWVKLNPANLTDGLPGM